MSGGVGLLCRDNATDYSRFRKEVFKIDIAPLPKSLTLSHADAELNFHAKLVVGQAPTPSQTGQ